MDTVTPSSAYRRFPTISVTAPEGSAVSGQANICSRIQNVLTPGTTVLVAETYPGVDQDASPRSIRH